MVTDARKHLTCFYVVWGGLLTQGPRCFFAPSDILVGSVTSWSKKNSLQTFQQ